MTDEVRLQRKGETVVVTIGSGIRRNALSSAGWQAIERTFTELAEDEALRVVIVRGDGDTFSAGSDMREWIHADEDGIGESFTRMEAAFRAIERLPAPVIAQIHGVAAGAGCQLALACDLRIMAHDARIGMPIARLGILVSPDFAARLIRLAGPGIAREMLYTGALVPAAEAVRLGLAGDSVPGTDLEAATARLAGEIAGHPIAAIRAAKAAVTAATFAPEASSATAPVAYEEFRDGITAFLTRH